MSEENNSPVSENGYDGEQHGGHSEHGEHEHHGEHGEHSEHSEHSHHGHHGHHKRKWYKKINWEKVRKVTLVSLFVLIALYGFVYLVKYMESEQNEETANFGDVSVTAGEDAGEKAGPADARSGENGSAGAENASAMNEPVESVLSAVKWCAMGDSITEGWYSEAADGQIVTGIDGSISWVAVAAQINGWQATNLAIGGSGWLRSRDDAEESAGAEEATAAEESTAAYALAARTDFSGYDLVTLAYGINDWASDLEVGSFADAPDGSEPKTVMQAMRMTIEEILESNPTCKIIVILPLNCAGNNGAFGEKETNYALGFEGLSRAGTLESFVGKMIEVCEYYGIEYVDMTHAGCVNRENLKELLGDGVHPTRRGHEVLGRELAGKIGFR